MLITTTEHQIVVTMPVEGLLFGYLAMCGSIGTAFGLILNLRDTDTATKSSALHALTIVLGLGGILVSIWVSRELYDQGGTVGDWIVTAISFTLGIASVFLSKSWHVVTYPL